MNLKIIPTLICASLTTLLSGCAFNQRPAAPPTANTKTQITEIHMLDAHNGWAWSDGLGGQRLLLHTDDGGSTWHNVTPTGFPYNEDGSCFRDVRTAWVPILNRTNYATGLLHTTDAGKSWSVLNQTNAPIFNEASSVRFFSSIYGVGNTSDGGLGSSDVTFFETHDAGKSWSRIPLRPRDPKFSESSNTFHLSNIGGDRIAFYPPASVIITYGDTADEQPKGVVRLSVTSNLGKTWHDLKLPMAKQYRNSLCAPLGPVFADKRNIVLAAHVFELTTNDSYSDGALIFYASHDGGSKWIAKRGVIDVKQPRYGNAFKVVSPECFLVANGSDICVTHDGAESWQIITPNISFGATSKRDIVQMDFVDENHGWLVISDHNEFHPDGNFILYRTSDGGKTWTELPMRIFR
jgi:photosystem II stability/assembly factor-like uncharacterized protein